MTEKKESPQEIDLLELASSATKGVNNMFIKLFNFIYKLLELVFKYIQYLLFYVFIAGKEGMRFLVRNSPIIIAFMIGGFLLGKVYVIKVATPYYRTSATLQTFTVGSANLIDFTNQLHDIAEYNDSIAFSKKLNMSVSEAASIKDIQAFWLIDKNRDGIADEIDYENSFTPDTILNWERMTNRFVVQLKTNKPGYAELIQQKYEAYLNTYPRLKRISDVKKQTLENRIKRINTELVIIDSLKRYEYFTKQKELLQMQLIQQQTQPSIALDKILFQTSSPEVDLQMPSERQLMHGITIELSNENLESERALELESDPFVFITKFAEVNNPVNIDKEKNVSLKFTLLFFILGSIFSFVINFWRSIFAFAKNKATKSRFKPMPLDKVYE